jgi:hypothetical protein
MALNFEQKIDQEMKVEFFKLAGWLTMRFQTQSKRRENPNELIEENEND